MDTIFSVTAFIPKSDTAGHLRTGKTSAGKETVSLGFQRPTFSGTICPSSNPASCTPRAVSYFQVQKPPSYYCWGRLPDCSMVCDTHPSSTLGVPQNPTWSLFAPPLKQVLLKRTSRPGGVIDRKVILKAPTAFSSRCPSTSARTTASLCSPNDGLSALVGCHVLL